MADLEQWVNVPKTEAFKKLIGAKSLERLGPVNISAKFKKASLAGFRVKIIPLDGAKHESYSAAERGRNSNFTVRVKGAATNTGKSSVKLDKNIFLNAAGGNRYKLKAKYKKKEIESGLTVKAHRFMIYQRIHMKGVASTDMSDVETELWKPAEKSFIKLHEEGADTEVKLIKTVHDSGANFIKAMAKGWKLGKTYKPYAMAVAFVNYIATPREVNVQHKVNLAVPSKLSKWNWKGSEVTFDTKQYLWYGLDDAHDKSQHWLVSCQFKFKPDDGSPVQTLGLDRDWVTITGSDAFPYGGRRKVKVKLDPKRFDRNFFTQMKGSLSISLRVRTPSFTNGLAYNVVNLLAVADKGRWDDRTKVGKLSTIVHELGHKFSMVADGNGRAPDKPTNHYTGKTHNGDHCSKGTNFNAGTSTWSGTPGCVMFGAGGIGGNQKPISFCGDCAPALRKVDLGEDTLKAETFKWSLDEV